MQVQDNPFIAILRFEHGELNFLPSVKNCFLAPSPVDLIISKVFCSYISLNVPSCVSL